MKFYQYKVVAVVLFSGLCCAACQEQESIHHKIEPAHVEHLKDSELSRLTLTEKAVKRLGIQTTQAAEKPVDQTGAQLRMVLPYSSLLYDVEGRTWVYTNPEPLSFIRYQVKVDFIEKDQAVLEEGPPVGTQVVTVGAAELYGTEYEVGH